MNKFISRDDLIEILDGKKKHEFISCECETKPKFIQHGRETGLSIQDKFNCSATDIVKLSQFTCMLGLDYQHVIETRLKKEGKEPSEYARGESWHEPYNNSRNIRQHKETKELYVYLFMVSNNNPISAFYNMSNGTMIDKTDLSEFLPKESTPKNQGLSTGNEIIVRTFKLQSIRKITIEHETYSIR